VLSTGKLSHALARARDERGAALAWFAIWLPVLIICVVFVVDVANWFEHKRHLQMQADAAALAGAGKFKLPLSLCDDTAVRSEARKYMGDHLDGGELLWQTTANYNDQIGKTPPSRIHGLINFQPSDPNRFWRSNSDDDGGSPCAARFIEVKLTEKDLPWFFGLPPSLVPWIDARARVSLQQLGTATGLLPIGVPETDPDAVEATFVNECNGTAIATTRLTKQATLDGDLVVWMNNGTGMPGDPGPVAVPMPSPCTKVGVRIAISSRGTNTDCSNQFVDCYEVASADGIRNLRSHPTTAGTSSAPQVRGVELLPASTGCADAYFYSDKKPCASFGVRAALDFGGPNPAGTRLEVRFDNSNPWVDMNYDATTGVFETAGFPFNPVDNQGNPLEGPRGVQLRWKSNDVCKTGGGCDLEAGAPVQRIYGGADHLSGPIKMIQVFESGVEIGSAADNSSPQLVVRIALTSSLKVAADVNDPPVALKLVGNQTQALNCDLDFTTLADELAYGCGQRVPPATPDSPFSEGYKENEGELNCRDTTKAELWSMTAANASDPTWPCVALKTGHTTNQVPQGLNMRVLGNDKPTICTSPNDWASYPDIDPEDPRIVHVFITPFGAFAGTGNDETVPVVGFATFYITGWTGQGSGFDNPCQGFTPSDDPVPNNDPGTIVGHFIRYIANVNTGSNGQPCEENSLTPCVAVLTD
jgi:Putative Flp pilus-assembly TadE/G-like